MPRRRGVTGRVVKPFDAATKHLLELDPAAWLAYVGLPSAGRVRVINSDVATIIAEADKVIRADDPDAWLAHIEPQASHDPTLGARLHVYNALLDRRHGLPVQSVALLLRPDADTPELPGRFRRRLPDGEVYRDFRYRVVRVWQQSVQSVLAGGLATLPLAPLAAGAEADLPGVVRRMGERVSAETTSDEAAQLWMSTYLLTGLRYPDDMIAQLLQGVRAMHESSTYQAILREGRDEGRAVEARAILLRLGSKRFGPPERRTRAAVNRLTGLERLERLTDRLLDVASWDELLTQD